MPDSPPDPITALTVRHEEELATLAHRLSRTEARVSRWPWAWSTVVAVILAALAVVLWAAVEAEARAKLAALRLDDAQKALAAGAERTRAAQADAAGLRAQVVSLQAAQLDAAEQVRSLGKLALELAAAGPATMPTPTSQPAAVAATSQPRRPMTAAAPGRVR